MRAGRERRGEAGLKPLLPSGQKFRSCRTGAFKLVSIGVPDAPNPASRLSHRAAFLAEARQAEVAGRADGQVETRLAAQGRSGRGARREP